MEALMAISAGLIIGALICIIVALERIRYKSWSISTQLGFIHDKLIDINRSIKKSKKKVK